MHTSNPVEVVSPEAKSSFTMSNAVGGLNSTVVSPSKPRLPDSRIGNLVSLSAQDDVSNEIAAIAEGLLGEARAPTEMLASSLNQMYQLVQRSLAEITRLQDERAILEKEHEQQISDLTDMNDILRVEVSAACGKLDSEKRRLEQMVETTKARFSSIRRSTAFSPAPRGDGGYVDEQHPSTVENLPLKQEQGVESRSMAAGTMLLGTNSKCRSKGNGNATMQGGQLDDSSVEELRRALEDTLAQKAGNNSSSTSTTTSVAVVATRTAGGTSLGGANTQQIHTFGPASGQSKSDDEQSFANSKEIPFYQGKAALGMSANNTSSSTSVGAGASTGGGNNTTTSTLLMSSAGSAPSSSSNLGAVADASRFGQSRPPSLPSALETLETEHSVKTPSKQREMLDVLDRIETPRRSAKTVQQTHGSVPQLPALPRLEPLSENEEILMERERKCQAIIARLELERNMLRWSLSQTQRTLGGTPGNSYDGLLTTGAGGSTPLVPTPGSMLHNSSLMGVAQAGSAGGTGGDSGSMPMQGSATGSAIERLESELTLREPEQMRDVMRSLDGIQTPTTPGRETPNRGRMDTLDRISEMEELLYEETMGNNYAAALGALQREFKRKEAFLRNRWSSELLLQQPNARSERPRPWQRATGEQPSQGGMELKVDLSKMLSEQLPARIEEEEGAAHSSRGSSKSVLDSPRQDGALLATLDIAPGSADNFSSAEIASSAALQHEVGAEVSSSSAQISRSVSPTAENSASSSTAAIASRSEGSARRQPSLVVVRGAMSAGSTAGSSTGVSTHVDGNPGASAGEQTPAPATGESGSDAQASSSEVQPLALEMPRRHQSTSVYNYRQSYTAGLRRSAAESSKNDVEIVDDEEGATLEDEASFVHVEVDGSTSTAQMLNMGAGGSEDVARAAEEDLGVGQVDKLSSSENNETDAATRGSYFGTGANMFGNMMSYLEDRLSVTQAPTALDGERDPIRPVVYTDEDPDDMLAASNRVSESKSSSNSNTDPRRGPREVVKVNDSQLQLRFSSLGTVGAGPLPPAMPAPPPGSIPVVDSPVVFSPAAVSLADPQSDAQSSVPGSVRHLPLSDAGTSAQGSMEDVAERRGMERGGSTEDIDDTGLGGGDTNANANATAIEQIMERQLSGSSTGGRRMQSLPEQLAAEARAGMAQAQVARATLGQDGSLAPQEVQDQDDMGQMGFGPLGHQVDNLSEPLGGSSEAPLGDDESRSDRPLEEMADGVASEATSEAASDGFLQVGATPPLAHSDDALV
ncbi:unnamed protein product [Amoebophrya sp. A25]|nr:unnamed protein product [Amoebophrya sp. A25]|eukprot:GSA25T00018784001.1